MNEHVRPEGRIALDGVVRQAVQVLMPLAADDGVSVTVEAPSQLPDVLGDRDELVQLFQNLVHNAIKYGREGGRITVTLGTRDGQVFAAVRDEGEGIEASAIPRLTERFYRVDVKRSRERGGTGLGLAIVKHIINRHQGRLSIESTKGVGSVFTVYLPEAPAQLPPAEAPAGGAAKAPAATVTEML
jgi:two-component system phosphate regulon sensor histidine kinase PhoR